MAHWFAPGFKNDQEAKTNLVTIFICLPILDPNLPPEIDRFKKLKISIYAT